ncbi:hypothetical protein PRZ48_014881 [Zasmidium cellare]|uniref:C2H2 type master regulator of conidiophore development brlA n=1 Tax=Zasmidium cellare TaxID=395010 RepID=A0ABR0DWZ4_ZASCE|nr:hypothetical protein PRZ48_014881 [Zasmidium cellare]
MYDPLETVNPADLIIPRSEAIAVPPRNVSSLNISQTFMQNSDELNMEPLWTESEWNGFVQQSAQMDSYPTWDTTATNPYGVYGTSPPTPGSFNMQSLARRLGSYDMTNSQEGSIDQFSISRDASFESVEQCYGRSSTPGPSSRRKAKRRRGRLLADMTYSGHSTVFEDSDSHHSWTAADNTEDWVSYLRERLADFRRCRERVALITSPLQTRQRRKVHSMANLWGLSHLSIGSGREKRVLLCKCELTKAPSHLPFGLSKRWNPTKNNWSPGLVDPRIVLFDLLSPRLSAAKVRQCLKEAGLPSPTKIVIDRFNPMKTGVVQPVATGYVLFENADDAALALLALDGTKPNWNSSDAEIECDYVHFPPGFELNNATLDAFDALPDLVRREKLKFHEGRMFSSIRSKDENNALYSSTESEADDYSVASPGLSMSIPTRRGHSSRKTSNSSSYSRDPGYVSGGSTRSLVASDYSSQTSITKKRKRVPKISGGFACSLVGCDRVFDRDGDRRKHEKNHTAERPHVCEKCGKGFLFPKDLRRHMIVHSITELPSGGDEEQKSEQETASTVKERERERPQSSPTALIAEDRLKRIYGKAGPPDRRISRISSFG